MKPRTLIRALAVCILIALPLTACQSGTSVSVNTDGENISGGITFPAGTNVDVSLGGSGNVATGEWSAGITITFKQQPPAFVVTQLKEAGAVKAKDPSLVWTIPKANALDSKVQKAVGAALTVPGTIITQAAK